MATIEEIRAIGQQIYDATDPESVTNQIEGDVIMKIASAMQDSVVGTNILGSKANVATIKSEVITPSKGDTYKATDTGHYWKYNDVISETNPYDPNKWVDIGIVIPSDVMLNGGTTKTGAQLDAEKTDIGNLFYVLDKYIGLNGTEYTSTTYKCTGFVPLDRDKDLPLKKCYGNQQNIPICAFYDEYFNLLSTYTTGVDGLQDVTILKSNFPSNAEYFRVNALKVSAAEAYVSTKAIARSYSIYRGSLAIPFSDKGYVDNRNGAFISSNFHYSTPYLYPDKDKIVVVGEGATTGVVAFISYFDIKLNFKGYYTVPTNGLQTIVINKSDLPDDVVLIRISVPTTQLVRSVSGCSVAKVESDIINMVVSKPYEVVSGTDGDFGASYKIKNVSKTGVFHLAFEFQLGEDVNMSDFVKQIARFESGSNYININVNAAPTSIHTGKDSKQATNILSTIPIPYFNSFFNIRSSLSVAGDYLNKDLLKRTLEMDNVKAPSPFCFKPLCGDDLFSIRILPIDTNGNEYSDVMTSTQAQETLANWVNAYIEVTSTSFNFVNPDLSINKSFLYADYTSLTGMYTAIATQLEALSLSDAKVIVTDYNTSGIRSNGSKYDHTKLLRCKLMLCTTYPKPGLTVPFYDSFPAYIPYSIDDSWHSFEIVTSDNLMDYMTWTIDGQYININGNFFIQGTKSFFKNSVIKFGHDLNIRVRNIDYQANKYDGVELKNYANFYHIIVSKLHPYIINFYGHDLYYKDNRGEDMDTKLRKFQSNGGTIPDSLKNPDPDYFGDDSIQAGREGLTFPSFIYEQGLSLAKARGYRHMTHEELSEFIQTGKASHNKYFMHAFDDYSTYIYANQKLRSIFEKYGFKPYFALELGYYVDQDAPTTLYSASDFITQNKDNNTHRLALQRRLKAMMANGYEIEMHGHRQGDNFQTNTYKQVMDKISEAINISNYLGVNSDYWCWAGNYYTPNAIKAMEHAGIRIATSVVGRFVSRCQHPCYVGRTAYLFTDTDFERFII